MGPKSAALTTMHLALYLWGLLTPHTLPFFPKMCPLVLTPLSTPNPHAWKGYLCPPGLMPCLLLWKMHTRWGRGLALHVPWTLHSRTAGTVLPHVSHCVSSMEGWPSVHVY